MKRIKRKKNPQKENLVRILLNNSDDYQFLGEGSEGEVYYFMLGEPLKLNKDILEEGEYVIKIYFDTELSENQIKYLQKLSNFNLIPKIFSISRNYIISQFINADSFSRVIKNSRRWSSERKLVYENIKNLISKWHSLGYAHEDLNPDNENILIDKKLNVYFIDPSINKETIKHPDFELDLAELDEVSKHFSSRVR